MDLDKQTDTTVIMLSFGNTVCERMFSERFLSVIHECHIQQTKTVMAASVDETPVDRKLDDIFEEAYNLYNGFDDCADPTNSPEFQVSESAP